MKGDNDAQSTLRNQLTSVIPRKLARGRKYCPLSWAIYRDYLIKYPQFQKVPADLVDLYWDMVRKVEDMFQKELRGQIREGDIK